MKLKNNRVKKIMDYATELRMKQVLRQLKVPALLLLLIVFSVSVVAPDPEITYFDKLAYRDGEGIFIDTMVLPVRVAGQDLKIKWGYDVENVHVPYKFATMPFWIEHNLPFAVDLCNGKISFKTTYPTSTWIEMDYNIYKSNFKSETIKEACASPFDEKSCWIDRIESMELVQCDVSLKKDVCEHTIQVKDGTFTAIPRKGFMPIADVESCPLEPNKRYYFQHRAEIPVGSKIVFDVSLELELPTLDKATFVIPAPSWIGDEALDYNTGVGFDFNWTKVTWDGNVMPTGNERYKNDFGFYDSNLLVYYKFDDWNANETGTPDDTNNGYDGELIEAQDIAYWGMWDTKSAYFVNELSYISAGDIDKLDNSNEFSVCMWVLHDDSSNDHSLAGKSNGTLDGWILFRDNIGVGGNDVYSFFVGDSTGTDNVRVESQPNTATLSAWNHVCATYTFNNATGLKMYVNGILQNTATTTSIGGIDSGTKPLMIGIRDGGTVPNFGRIDEFKIWDKALTPEEIQADYNSWMHSKYDSPVINFAFEELQWNTLQWQQTVDVNNNITVDYRSCDDAECNGESWITGLRNCTASACELEAADNIFFQYRVNFDTNTQQWNKYSNVTGGPQMFGRIKMVTIDYDTVAGTTCDCPASGHWEINDGSVCTLSTICSLNGGSLHVSNGSLTVTSTGTLSVPPNYKVIIDKTNSKLVVEKSGKVIVNK